MNPLAVGVDIGGTKIDLVLLDTSGTVHAEHRLPTLAAEGPAAVLDRVADGITRLLQDAPGPVSGIGIGCPGHVDPVSGVVRTAVNLGWTEVALRQEVLNRLLVDLPIACDNDVNAAALGEYYFGAARGLGDLVYLAVGTGLGAGALVNGHIVVGAGASAMEVGHLSFDPGGRLCRCGGHGCAEMYVAGVGLIAGAKEHRPDYPDTILPAEAAPSDILAAARAGDALACTVMNEAAVTLGQIMACCASLFDPAALVIGGGLGLAAADLLIDPAQEAMRQRVLPDVADSVRVVRSGLERIALGAACLAFEAQRETNPCG
ncbi:ROK family protein [Aggregatilinea lenta]|uniref:ROK family protein n=1 Tax=Aggregatilinea lenta TaxID=913108 RepID=UPI000E5C2E8C|nr:ROK family protein [Aggregatilinea lenta]